MPALPMSSLKQPDEHRSPSCDVARARVGCKVEFSPNPESSDEGGAKPQMPTLPLHLLKSEQEPGSRASSMSMNKSLSACSLGSNSVVSFGGGTGFSDSGSMASLTFGNLSADAGPSSLRGADMPAVPNCFKCKVSQQVMQDPVRLPDGTVCERANLSALGHGAAAGEGAPKPDPLLAEAIKSYFELRKASERQVQEWQTLLTGRTQHAHQKLVQRQRQMYKLRVALDQTRRKVHALEEKNVPSTSPSTTSPDSSHRDAASVGWDHNTSNPTEEERAIGAPQWRSGPAPRSGGATPATRKASERRRSTWSFLSGKASP